MHIWVINPRNTGIWYLWSQRNGYCWEENKSHDWDQEQRGTSGMAGKVLFLDLDHGCKSVHLKTIHWGIHLFCVWFDNKKILNKVKCLSFHLKKVSQDSGEKNTKDYNSRLTFQSWFSITLIHLSYLLQGLVKLTCPSLSVLISNCMFCEKQSLQVTRNNSNWTSH